MYWIPIDRSLGRAALLEVRGGRPGAAVEVAVVAPVIEESPAKRTAGELEDALRTFPADEVLVFENDEGHARWLEDGLLERARKILDRPLRLAGASDNAATWPRSRSHPRHDPRDRLLRRRPRHRGRRRRRAGPDRAGRDFDQRRPRDRHRPLRERPLPGRLPDLRPRRDPRLHAARGARQSRHPARRLKGPDESDERRASKETTMPALSPRSTFCGTVPPSVPR